ERVFSSAKETDTLRRSNLAEVTMEVLQITKYLSKHATLDFSDGWVTSESDLEVVALDPSEINELIATRRVDKLAEIILKAHELR
ncbi:hypothetical protein FA13DRAFT_1628437, partial [Coprinellus micaceus]